MSLSMTAATSGDDSGVMGVRSTIPSLPPSTSSLDLATHLATLVNYTLPRSFCDLFDGSDSNNLSLSMQPFLFAIYSHLVTASASPSALVLTMQLKECQEAFTEATRTIERKQGAIERLESELDIQINRVKESREALLKADERIITLEDSLRQSTVNASKWQQEAERTSRQLEWTQEELKQTLESLALYRKQKTVEVADLQARLDTTLEQSKANEGLLSELRQALEHKDRSLEKALSQTRDLQAKLAQSTADFESEMGTKTRLVELYRSATEEAQAKIVEMQGSLKQYSDLQASMEAQLTVFKEDKDKVLDQLQSQLERKEHELTLVNSQIKDLLTSGGSVNGTEQLLLSPSAGIAKRLHSSGKSLSDLYAEHAQAKAELVKSKQENDRLKLALQEICTEIEARVPQIQEERKEAERLRRELQAASQQLISLSRQVDEAEEWRTRATQAEQEVLALKFQVGDLSKQVAVLLAQIEGINMDEGDNEKVHALEENVDVETLISSRLVSFKNIRELHEKNQQLLRATRALSEQINELVSQKEDGLAMEENGGAHDSHGSIIAQQQAMIETITKQRDMFRDIAEEAKKKQSQPPTPPVKTGESSNAIPSNILTPNQPSTEQFRILQRQLEQTLDQTRTELSQSRVELAKAQAQLDFANERLTIAQQSSGLHQRELETLRIKQTESLDTILKQQSQLQATLADLVSAREREQRVSLQVQSLQAEVSMLHAAERRAQEECQQLSQERSRLARLVTNLQSMLSEHGTQDVELRTKLNTQLEVTERDLQTCRRRLLEQANEHKATLAQHERERKDLFIKVTDLTEQLSKCKEQLASHSATAGYHTTRITELEATKSSLEERLNQLASMDTPGTDPTRELASTHLKLAALKEELRVAREHNIHYQRLAQEAQASLDELTGMFDQYRQAHTNELDESRNEVQRLNDELEQKQVLIETRQRELEEMKSALHEKERQWQQERANLDSQLNQLQDYEQEIKKQRQAFSSDLSKLQAELQSTKDTLAQESDARAKDIFSLHSIREQLTLKESELEHAKSQINHLQETNTTMQARWQTEREYLEGQITSLRTKITELQSENETLVNQATQNMEGDGEADNQQQSVLSYLRRQRDIAQCELDTLTLDHRRLQSQLDTTQRLLDETRALLDEERSASSPRHAQMMEQYKTLLARVDQFNIVRESNQVLRQENERLNAQVAELERTLKQVQDTEMAELQAKLMDLHARVQTHEHEVRILREDRDRWKVLASGIQHPSVARVGDEQSAHSNSSLVSSLEAKLAEREAQIESQAAAIERYTRGISSLTATRSELKEKRAEVDRLQQEFTHLQAQHQEQLAKQRHEHELHRSVLISKYENQLKKLQQELLTREHRDGKQENKRSRQDDVDEEDDVDALIGEEEEFTNTEGDYGEDNEETDTLSAQEDGELTDEEDGEDSDESCYEIYTSATDGDEHEGGGEGTSNDDVHLQDMPLTEEIIEDDQDGDDVAHGLLISSDQAMAEEGELEAPADSKDEEDDEEVIIKPMVKATALNPLAKSFIPQVKQAIEASDASATNLIEPTVTKSRIVDLSRIGTGAIRRSLPALQSTPPSQSQQRQGLSAIGRATRSLISNRHPTPAAPRTRPSSKRQKRKGVRGGSEGGTTGSGHGGHSYHHGGPDTAPMQN